MIVELLLRLVFEVVMMVLRPYLRTMPWPHLPELPWPQWPTWFIYWLVARHW